MFAKRSAHGPVEALWRGTNRGADFHTVASLRLTYIGLRIVQNVQFVFIVGLGLTPIAVETEMKLFL